MVWGCGADGRLGLGAEPDTLARLARAQRAATLRPAAAALVRGALEGELTSSAPCADDDEDATEAAARMRKRVLSANHRKPRMLGKLRRAEQEIVSVAVGSQHAAAVSSDGKLWVWGDLSLHEDSGLTKSIRTENKRTAVPQPRSPTEDIKADDEPPGCGPESDGDVSSDSSDWPEWAKKRRSSLGASSESNPFATPAVAADSNEGESAAKPKGNPFALASSSSEDEESACATAPRSAPNPFALPESDDSEGDEGGGGPSTPPLSTLAAQAGEEGLPGIVAFLLAHVSADVREAVKALPAIAELGPSAGGFLTGATTATAAVSPPAPAPIPVLPLPLRAASAPPAPPVPPAPASPGVADDGRGAPLATEAIAVVNDDGDDDDDDDDDNDDDEPPEDSCWYEPMWVSKIKGVKQAARRLNISLQRKRCFAQLRPLSHCWSVLRDPMTGVRRFIHARGYSGG